MLNRVVTENNILLAWNWTSRLPNERSCSNKFIGPEPIFAVGPHTLRDELRKKERASRNRHWQQMPVLRQARLFLKSSIQNGLRN